MYKILFIICLLFLSNATLVSGQETQGQERGEVKDAEFIIRKDRILTLPKQPRVFERTPVLPSSQGKGNYTYEVKNFFLDLKPLITETSPFQKVFADKKDRMFHNYLKLGYGNFQSPLAELHINNVESDVINFGVLLKHQGFYEGPVDGKNSAEDHTNIRFDGSFFQETSEIFGKVGYDRDRYHFYGYTQIPALEIVPDDISQIFHTLYGNIGIRKIDRLDVFNYEASLSLKLFNDNYLAREHELGIQTLLGFRGGNDRLLGEIRSQAFLSSPSDATYSDINRNYIKFNPYLEYSSESFRVIAGANIILENDVVPNKTSDFHIFPSLFASYHLTESFGLYAGYEGDVIRNTYHTFVQENPYLGPSDELRNTIQNYQVEAGVQGSLNDALSYKTGFKFGEFTNMHFYGNHRNDSTKFQLIYDDISQVLNYHASLEWNYGAGYTLQAAANYFHYKLSEFESAWHRPEWEINLNNSFAPNEKWLITANGNLMGGIRAINLQSGQTATLKAIIDLSAKVDYSFSPRFSIFVAGNNLFNQSNERYWNYRVRGIQGIGGLSFKF